MSQPATSRSMWPPICGHLPPAPRFSNGFNGMVPLLQMSASQVHRSLSVLWTQLESTPQQSTILRLTTTTRFFTWTFQHWDSSRTPIPQRPSRTTTSFTRNRLQMPNWSILGSVLLMTAPRRFLTSRQLAGSRCGHGSTIRLVFCSILIWMAFCCSRASRGRWDTHWRVIPLTGHGWSKWLWRASGITHLHNKVMNAPYFSV